MFFSRQVHQFIIAVQEGSFIKAAEKISITPSAMSRGIAELEQKIGGRLIKRTRHGIEMTAKGERLYRELLPHYNEVQGLISNIKEKNGIRNITIWTDGLYLPKFKQKLLQLIKENPEYNVSLLPGNKGTPEEILGNNFADIYISTKRPEYDGDIKNITSISMKPELIGTLMHRQISHQYKNLKSALEKIKIVQTHAAHNHIFFRDILRELTSKGCKFDVLPVADLDEVSFLVNEGAGITFISNRIINDVNISPDVIFQEKPLDQVKILQRYICFRSERFSELMNICSTLGDS